MSEEIKPGQNYLRHETINVTQIIGDRIYIYGKVSGFCYLSSDDFKAEMQSGVLSVINSDQPHTFTDAELERLIAVVAKKQRGRCVLAMKGDPDTSPYHMLNKALNAPAPTLSQVMEKYKEVME